MGYSVLLKVTENLETWEIMRLSPLVLYCDYKEGECFTTVENGKHHRYQVLERLNIVVKEIPVK